MCALVWAVWADAQEYQVCGSDSPNFGLPPWQILKFDRDGDNLEVFIGQHLDWPHDILFLEEAGTVLVCNFNSGRIESFNAATLLHLTSMDGGNARGLSGTTLALQSDAGDDPQTTAAMGKGLDVEYPLRRCTHDIRFGDRGPLWVELGYKPARQQ